MASKNLSSVSNSKNMFAALLDSDSDNECQMQPPSSPVSPVKAPAKTKTVRRKIEIEPPCAAPVVETRAPLRTVRAAPPARVKTIRLAPGAQRVVKTVTVKTVSFREGDFPPLGSGGSKVMHPGDWARGIQPLRDVADLPDPHIAIMEAERQRRAIMREYARTIDVDEDEDFEQPQARRVIDLDDVDEIDDQSHRFPRMKESDRNTLIISRHAAPMVITADQIAQQQRQEEEAERQHRAFVRREREREEQEARERFEQEERFNARFRCATPEPDVDCEFDDWEQRIPTAARSYWDD